MRLLDNQIIALVIATIIAQEQVAGIPGTPIAQAFQPTQQGVNTAPTAYLNKIGDNRLGSPQRSDVWDGQRMVHTELQQYETTFQISALSTQDPNTPTQMTTSDLLNLIAYILQSTATVEAFQAAGVGILKIGQVRNPYFIDDRDLHEASPSFDFVIVHKQIVTSVSPVVQSTEFEILTV